MLLFTPQAFDLMMIVDIVLCHAVQLLQVFISLTYTSGILIMIRLSITEIRLSITKIQRLSVTKIQSNHGAENVHTFYVTNIYMKLVIHLNLSGSIYIPTSTKISYLLNDIGGLCKCHIVYGWLFLVIRNFYRTLATRSCSLHRKWRGEISGNPTGLVLEARILVSRVRMPALVITAYVSDPSDLLDLVSDMCLVLLSLTPRLTAELLSLKMINAYYRACSISLVNVIMTYMR
ncbi:hypothetical protein BDR06DRAFT_975784 [Suillus hirtellus]|nr:hypothetical protein BDR06DRAFT_975784 [Suillus hirtellus]